MLPKKEQIPPVKKERSSLTTWIQEIKKAMSVRNLL